MDDAAWGALTLSLTLVGALWTWISYRRRGTAAAVRASGVTLLPIALLLTHTLRMVTRIGDAVGDWATALVFSPQVWLGVLLGGLGITLFVVGGMMRDRKIGVAAPARQTGELTGATSRGGSPSATPSDRAAALPEGRSASRRRTSADPETEEIEALLRKHGIS